MSTRSRGSPPETETPPRVDGPQRPRTREGRWFLEILAVTSFVVAQPILDIFGKSPETFVFRGASRIEIVAFALLVTVVPAAGLWGLGAAAAVLGPRARRVAQTVLIGGLLAILGVQVVKKLAPLRGVGLALIGIAIGAVLTWSIFRFDAVRRWLRLVSPASVAFVLIFLLLSPVSKLILPAPEGEAAAKRAAPVPVVMVMWDQFPTLSLLDRTGQVNERLFPNIAELAGGSTWFRNYTVTEPHTYFSIPTVLTGRLATDRTKEALAVDYPDNLFSLLSESHHMEVIEPVTSMCPGDVCSNEHEPVASSAPAPAAVPPPARETSLLSLSRDAARIWMDVSLPHEVTRDITAQFDDPGQGAGEPALIPEGGGEAGEGHDEERAAAGEGIGGDPWSVAFRDLVRSFGAAEQPSVHYVHTLLPHLPWRRFPSGSVYQTLGGPRDDQPLDRDQDPWKWVDDTWAVQLARQRQLLQTRYVDGLVGDMVRGMKEAGIYDDALLIMTADHGVSLHAGRSRGGTQDNMHEIFWVPLFMKFPGQQEGVVDDRNVTAPDILPTIADVLGVSIPWETHGRSMLEAGHDRGPAKTVRLYADEPQATDTLRLRIAVEEAERRLRREAFAPDVPTRDPEMAPFLVGPGADLIGRPIADLSLGPPSGRGAVLDVPTGTRMRPGRPIPAFFWGVLESATESSDALVAVAVNGRVAGVSTVWTQDGVPGRFAVVAPESFFRSGDNDIELFELEGDVLRPLRVDL